MDDTTSQVALLRIYSRHSVQSIEIHSKLLMLALQSLWLTSHVIATRKLGECKTKVCCVRFVNKK